MGKMIPSRAKEVGYSYSELRRFVVEKLDEAKRTHFRNDEDIREVMDEIKTTLMQGAKLSDDQKSAIESVLKLGMLFTELPNRDVFAETFNLYKYGAAWAIFCNNGKRPSGVTI